MTVIGPARLGLAGPVERLAEGGVAVIDGGALVVRERDGDEHPLQVGLLPPGAVPVGAEKSATGRDLGMSVRS
jgi:hypothetical protein